MDKLNNILFNTNTDLICKYVIWVGLGLFVIFMLASNFDITEKLCNSCGVSNFVADKELLRGGRGGSAVIGNPRMHATRSVSPASKLYRVGSNMKMNGGRGAMLRRRYAPYRGELDMLRRKNAMRYWYQPYGIRTGPNYTIDNTTNYIDQSTLDPTYVSVYTDYNGEPIHLYFHYDRTQPSYDLWFALWKRLRDTMEAKSPLIFKEVDDSNTGLFDVQSLPKILKYKGGVAYEYKGLPEYTRLHDWALQAT